MCLAGKIWSGVRFFRSGATWSCVKHGGGVGFFYSLLCVVLGRFVRVFETTEVQVATSEVYYDR